MQPDNKTQCHFCLNSKNIDSDNVDCGYWNRVMKIPLHHCAAQQLTSEGWENAAQRAKDRGDMPTANQHYLMAIATQKATVTTIK